MILPSRTGSRCLGLSRGLLVQSMMYYPSYELALHGLCLMPDRLRGVVSPRAEITDRELDILTKAGVVGVRFTRPTGAIIDDRLVRRTHEFGLGMHYLLHNEEQMWAWRNQILASPGKFVIEHLGNPPVEQGVDSATFKFVLECIDTGRCWVKLSPRPSKQETFPFSDVLPLVRQLVARAPNRLLWGSDWPHPVLEVGTGSGYQAAVLSQLARKVCTVEIIPPLAEAAAELLRSLGYDNVSVKAGDGYYGWLECGPFDAIVVTAALEHVPPPLIEQLKPGGRLVMPLGNAYATQQLTVVEKVVAGETKTRSVMLVRFVPFTRSPD